MSLPRPTETYLVAPGFDKPRGGSIRLGNIFKRPHELFDVPLSFVPPDDTGIELPKQEDPVIEIQELPDVPATEPGKDNNDADGKDATEPNEGNNDADGNDATPRQTIPVILVGRGDKKHKAKGWVKILNALRIGVSTEAAKNTHIVYYIDRLETNRFSGEGIKEYVKQRITLDPDLHEFLDGGQPAYMVYGIKYSTGLRWEAVIGKESDTKADLVATADKQVQAGLEAERTKNRARERKEVVRSEVVFAYQLLKIWYPGRKDAKLEYKVHHDPDAALLGSKSSYEEQEEYDEDGNLVEPKEEYLEPPRIDVDIEGFAVAHAEEEGLVVSDLGEGIVHVFEE